jgi:hypothetical protein
VIPASRESDVVAEVAVTLNTPIFDMSDEAACPEVHAAVILAVAAEAAVTTEAL